jgi:hypothetical protein
MFYSYLARHGKNNFYKKIVLNSFFFNFKIVGDRNKNWKNLFFLCTSFLQKPGNSEINLFNPYMTKNPSDNELGFNKYLNLNLKNLNLIFSFYIYKVDKHIYKNSRGKSGKFTFIWKYIPSYKRISRIVYWLVKEVKIAPGKTLQQRINLVLTTLFNNPSRTLIWRIKKFSLNYTYYSLRRSLLETFRTSAK